MNGAAPHLSVVEQAAAFTGLLRDFLVSTGTAAAPHTP